MLPEENNAVVVLQLQNAAKLNLLYVNEGAAEKKMHRVPTGAVVRWNQFWSLMANYENMYIDLIDVYWPIIYEKIQKKKKDMH